MWHLPAPGISRFRGLFRRSFRTASIQPGGASRQEPGPGMDESDREVVHDSQDSPVSRMSRNLAGGTVVAPLDLSPTVLQDKCRTVTGTDRTVLQATDRTVRLTGKQGRKPTGALNGPSTDAPAQPHCQFPVALCGLVRMGLFRQTVWMSWGPGTSGLVFERGSEQVTRGLYISDRPIAVSRIRPWRKQWPHRRSFPKSALTSWTGYPATVLGFGIHTGGEMIENLRPNTRK